MVGVKVRYIKVLGREVKLDRAGLGIVQWLRYGTRQIQDSEAKDVRPLIQKLQGIFASTSAIGLCTDGHRNSSACIAAQSTKRRHRSTPNAFKCKTVPHL